MKAALRWLVSCTVAGEHAVVELPEDLAGGYDSEEYGEFLEVAGAFVFASGFRVVRVTCSPQTTPEDFAAAITGTELSAASRTRWSSVKGRSRSKGKGKAKSKSKSGDSQAEATVAVSMSLLAAPGSEVTPRNRKAKSSEGGDGLPPGLAQLRLPHVILIENAHLVGDDVLQRLLDVLSTKRLQLRGLSLPVNEEAFTVVIVLPRPISRELPVALVSTAFCHDLGEGEGDPIAIHFLTPRQKVGQVPRPGAPAVRGEDRRT